jgi:hypothetical protein
MVCIPAGALQLLAYVRALHSAAAYAWCRHRAHTHTHTYTHTHYPWCRHGGWAAEAPGGAEAFDRRLRLRKQPQHAHPLQGQGHSRCAKPQTSKSKP